MFSILATYQTWRGTVTFRKQGDSEPTSGTAEIVWTSLIALAAIMLPVFSRVGLVALFFMRFTTLLLSRLVFYATLVAMAWICMRRLRSQTASRDRVTVILLLAGGFWAIGSAMSYMVEQHSVILGVAFLTAMAYDSQVQAAYKRRVTAACLLFVAASAWTKYNDSFDWHGWRSSVSLSPVRSRWRQLADYQVDRATVETYDTILNDVIRYSKPGEPIFTFMSMPMFKWITGRPQPTLCPVHYFDVCPDDISEADAQRVEAAKPAVLVVMWMPEELWRDQEEGFRRGQRSGQRAIQKVIDDLTSSGNYTLVHSFRGMGYRTPIYVWARVQENQAEAKPPDPLR